MWDATLKKMAHYRDLIKHSDAVIKTRWTTSGENKYGRLFQGFEPNNIKGMDVLEWIIHKEVPTNKKATYPRYTVAFRPEKDEQYRCQITAGGDRLEYDGPTSTQVSNMETFEVLLNSTMLSEGQDG